MKLMLISKNLHKFLAASVLLVLVVVAVVVDNVAYAQSTGMGVTPRKDVTVKTGQSLDDTLYVTNLNKNASLKVTVRVVDFGSVNQTGSALLKLDTSADPTPWSLKPFIKLPTTLTLNPGETQSVPYSIAVPKNQGAGSYYSAIQYTAEGEKGQSVSVSASAATLVFVTVPGKAREQLSLTKFGTYDRQDKEQDGSFRSFFIGSQPKRLAYLMHNSGSVAESPAGSIEITNLFGKQVRLITDANPKRNLALIGQDRRFEVCLNTATRQVKDAGTLMKVDYCKNPELMPGIYKAHLNLFYGINGSSTQEIDKTIVFWYMPYWAIAVLVALIALLAFGIYRMRKTLVTYVARR